MSVRGRLARHFNHFWIGGRDARGPSKAPPGVFIIRCAGPACMSVNMKMPGERREYKLAGRFSLPPSAPSRRSRENGNPGPKKLKKRRRRTLNLKSIRRFFFPGPSPFSVHMYSRGQHHDLGPGFRRGDGAGLQLFIRQGRSCRFAGVSPAILITFGLAGGTPAGPVRPRRAFSLFVVPAPPA